MSVAELAEISTRLSLGKAQAFRNLAVVPLLDPQAPPSGLLTLDDALSGGATKVTEVSESGSVPQLKLLNRGDGEVFLLDGEELAGAKQNRILNLSVLVPGRSELEIPVSCVEQGRWSWRGRGFSGTERVIYSKLRRRNSEAVSASLHSFRSPRGDQGQVWEDIAQKSVRMSVHSDTGAASALYERHREDLDEFVVGIAAAPGQVGAAFLVDGQFAGLDLLAGPDLLDRLLPKLVRSYALDAMDEGEAGSPTGQRAAPGVDAVKAVLQAVAEMTAVRHRAVGRGDDLRLEGAGLVGGALVANGTVVHLGVWAEEYR